MYLTTRDLVERTQLLLERLLRMCNLNQLAEAPISELEDFLFFIFDCSDRKSLITNIADSLAFHVLGATFEQKRVDEALLDGDAFWGNMYGLILSQVPRLTMGYKA